MGGNIIPYPTFGFLTLDIRPSSLSSPMPKIINLLNRSLDHETCRSLSDRAAIVPKGRLLTRLHSASYVGQAFRLLFIFSFLIFHCGLDVEDPTPPTPPIWVEKSFPEEWPERGIDAHESGGIILEWEPNPQDNITAYLLHRAQYYEAEDSLGDFDQINRLDMGENNELSFLDSDVRVNTQYFYALKAEDVSSNESEFSDTLDYTLLPEISPASMSPNGLGDTIDPDRTLSWSYSYTVAMEDYCLTIVDSEGNLILRERFSPGNYVSGAESRMIPDSISLQQGQTYRWRVDTGAQYTDQLERSGSESPWATFLYAGE